MKATQLTVETVKTSSAEEATEHEQSANLSRAVGEVRCVRVVKMRAAEEGREEHSDKYDLDRMNARVETSLQKASSHRHLECVTRQ